MEKTFILHAEDGVSFAESFHTVMSECYPEFEIKWCLDGFEALDFLKKIRVKLI